MGVLQSIIIGVISGVLTSIVLWFSYSVVFLKIFLPRLESVLYQGVIIEGRWSNKKLADTTSYEIVLDIEQKGYNISATFVASHKVNKSDNNYYLAKGKVNQGYVMLNYKATSRQKLGMGCILLRIEEGGDALIGTILYIDEAKMNTQTIKDIKFVKT